MKNILREFACYIGVGGIAFLADFAVMAILSSVFRVHYLNALVIAFLVGSIVNYQLSVKWVFAYRAIPVASIEFGLFLIVGVMTLGFSFILMTWLVEVLHLHYLLAKCLTTGVTVIINFTGRKALLFTPWVKKSQVHIIENPSH